MSAAANGRQARILVVDNEASMRFVLREVMEREGYHVSEADDGDTISMMKSGAPRQPRSSSFDGSQTTRTSG